MLPAVQGGGRAERQIAAGRLPQQLNYARFERGRGQQFRRHEPSAAAFRAFTDRMRPAGPAALHVDRHLRVQRFDEVLGSAVSAQLVLDAPRHLIQIPAERHPVHSNPGTPVDAERAKRRVVHVLVDRLRGEAPLLNVVHDCGGADDEREQHAQEGRGLEKAGAVFGARQAPEQRNGCFSELPHLASTAVFLSSSIAPSSRRATSSKSSEYIRRGRKAPSAMLWKKSSSWST